METGVIRRWLKRPGDTVAVGEPLLEIETDKVTMEVEAEASGTLLAALHPEGATVPVTETVAWLGQPGETPPAVTTRPSSSPSPAVRIEDENADEDDQAATRPSSSLSSSPAPARAPDGRVPATPAARRLARERGLDLARVTPSHPDGALRLRDVAPLAARRVTPLARALAAEAGLDPLALDGSGCGGKVTAADITRAVAGRPRRVPLSGMRRLIAERMALSRREIPDATLALSADVTDLFAWRERRKRAGGSVPSVNDAVLYAVAAALAEFPFLNATFEQGEILCWPDVNLGVAVAVDNGLVVPVLRGAQRLTLDALSDLARDTVAQARAGKLPPDAYLGGTFTVTNLGMLGIAHFTPIINPPQTAILGVCAAEERPVRRGGRTVWRTSLPLCLTHDHRVIDGALGAAFLNRVKKSLENWRSP